MCFQFSAMTPLHYASKAGHAEVCQLMLDVGTDEYVPDAVKKALKEDVSVLNITNEE